MGTQEPLDRPSAALQETSKERKGAKLPLPEFMVKEHFQKQDRVNLSQYSTRPIHSLINGGACQNAAPASAKVSLADYPEV